MKRDSLLEAMNFRYACKKFDVNKKISQEDLDLILECTRLTPSSFGLEPTRLLIIKNTSILQELKKICWNQDQITTASAVVVFKSMISDLDAPNEYVSSMIRRKAIKRDDCEEFIVAYQKRFVDFLEQNNIKSNIFAWTSKQSYLMASTMMNSAAYLGIDSCPIEGFEKKKVESLLGMDSSKEQVSIIITLGYRDHTQGDRFRLSKEEFVSFLE